MRRYSIAAFLLFSLFTLVFPTGPAVAQNPETTCFQTASPWRPELDIRSDAAIVYGVNRSFPERVRGWRDRGYIIHLMTGVAWGGYHDYLEGRFDGKNHMDEGQVQRNGEMIMHGPGVPYMVPTTSYVEYLKSLVKIAIDEGVEAIHLEEPEFWNRGGYSEGFKREWQAYYHEPWQGQHESPEATYRSAKLKYHLYFRALKEIFLFAKEYSESQGRPVRCYVPTHTLINYSAWQIVSPESSLADLPGMDGYIAQVWTGTARSPLFYQGVEKERTFENAFLEYGSMVAMTKPTGRRVYFLTDPIEDRPNYTWEDYRKNYEATFTAQLMHPSVAHYEVMPWPHRIFLGKYKTEDSEQRQPIPADYAAEILVLINALNDMKASDAHIPGTQRIGVLLSDTMMFQRFPTHEGYEDPRLSNFYGMALPLLKRGVPVQLVQMENLLQPDALKDIRLLIMSYANMKPLKEEYHDVLAQWVKDGGSLIYCGRDNDPFQSIREWWNGQGRFTQSPAQHLIYKALGCDPSTHGCDPTNSRLDSGDFRNRIDWICQDPKEFIMQKNGDEALLSSIQRMGIELEGKNRLHLQRGAFDIAAVFDESVSDEPYTIAGPVIDLFDPALPVLKEKVVHPDQRVFLYNLKRNDKPAPSVLAASSRAYEEKRGEHQYSFVMKSPVATDGVARILLPSKPTSSRAVGPDGQSMDLQPQWDAETKTLLVRYPNQPDGVRIEVEF
ncbi:MAG: hypothetical protein JXR73_21525 [Candidatus Omnitrophica bacterium]|nr:hypothetical protein [Candidatus Omnitrophota bacterium]